MKKNIALEFKTHTGSTLVVNYTLADNPVAHEWYEKIKLLQNQGLKIDQEFTSDAYGSLQSYTWYKQQLDKTIDWVNQNTGYFIVKKDRYDQTELCAMHDIYVDMTQDPLCLAHPETYQLNKYIHCVEFTVNGNKHPGYFAISWGLNDGVTMQSTDQNFYRHYTTNLIPGNMYLYWAEIGKRPTEYWRDNDPENLENFLNVTCPHHSWSAHCKINIKGSWNVETKFWQWFETYRQPFLSKWGLTEWTELHETGAVELAQICNPQDHLTLLKHDATLLAVRATN
jgi:hypothetical protein